jgi:integrase
MIEKMDEPDVTGGTTEGFVEWLGQKQISPTSKVIYSSVIKKFLKDVGELNQEKINKWMVNHPRAFYRASLKHWFEFKGLSFKLISVKEPPVTPRGEVERKKLNEVLGKINDKEVYWIFKLLYFTGARVSEILKLKLGDVDFENKTVTLIPKGAETGRSGLRVVKIPAQSLDGLKEYLMGVKGLLATQKCFFTEAEDVHSSHQRLLYYIGEERGLTDDEKKLLTSTHNFRRAIINWILTWGNITDAKSFIGHSDIRTTQRYVDKRTEKIKKEKVEEKIETEG